MARSITGKPNPWDRIPDLPADHPLFKRGFVIGMRRAANLPTTDEPDRPEDDLGDWTEAVDGFVRDFGKRLRKSRRARHLEKPGER